MKAKAKPKSRIRSSSSSSSNDSNSNSKSNHWKLDISVMGATPKQRSIYINTWIDIKASAKKKQAIRTSYGQFFHIQQKSPSISLDLFVHDIQNNTQIHTIWDKVVVNVIVLPYNHQNDSVDKPLKQLIGDLPHTNIPLKQLFNKTLLICPSNFHSMTKLEYKKQTEKVSEGLFELIHSGLAPFTKNLKLHRSQIVMMESGRKSSLLPTGKDWRVIAAEYTLKYLIFNDRDRKAFIAWILNMPKPLTAQNIMFISQRLKSLKAAPSQKTYAAKRRSGKKKKYLNVQPIRKQFASHSVGSHQEFQRNITAKKAQKQRSILSKIVRDFEEDSDGIEATLNSKYKQLQKEKKERKENLSKNNKREEDEKMDPNLAALMAMTDDEDQEDENQIVNEQERKRKKKEEEEEEEPESENEADTESEEESDTDSSSNDTESDEEECTDSESESDETEAAKKRKHKKKSDSLKEFCSNENLTKYYKKMVKLGFVSSAEFLDLSDEDLNDLVQKLQMLFKDEKQFRKVINCAKMACGLKVKEAAFELELDGRGSFSPLSGCNPENGSFLESMEAGISKMALIELTQKLRQFSKISEQCALTLHKLGSTYEAAQIEMDSVYADYKRQIDAAQATAKAILQSFVTKKRDKIVSLQKCMKMSVNTMKKCEEQCCKQYKAGNQDKISQIIQDTMRAMKLPSDFSVSSWRFDVEYVEKLDIFPPVLQPDDIPHFQPLLGKTGSHKSNNSQSSVNSLHEVIENNLKSPGQIESKFAAPTPILSTQQSGLIKKPLIRRNSIVLGDFDPNEAQQKAATVAVVSPLTRRPSYINNAFNCNPNILNAYSPLQAAQLAQQQMLMNNQFMMNNMNPMAAQQHVLLQQQQLQHLQQQQAMLQQNMTQRNSNSNHGAINILSAADDDIKANDVASNPLLLSPRRNKYEWLDTKDLWRGGRVQIDANSATITGSVCVIADIEICKRDGVFYWEIYVEKISNRCWIGILPGPISGINWKIGECPPTNNQAVGIENTYGFIYKSTTKCGSIGRAPKNRDHIRFKLDIKNNVLYGSLNEKEVNTVFYRGEDMPQIACVAIINSTGKGKFHIRS